MGPGRGVRDRERFEGCSGGNNGCRKRKNRDHVRSGRSTRKTETRTPVSPRDPSFPRYSVVPRVDTGRRSGEEVVSADHCVR